MFLRAVAVASILLVGCTANPEKVYKPAPLTPDYAVSINWANNFADIGVDKYARLLPAVSETVVIMADSEGHLFHYEKKTGKLLWTKAFDTRFSGGPLVSGDVTILGTQNAEVFALATKDGKQLWKQTLSSEILSTPQIKDDVVIAQTNDGKVYGLSAKSGKVTWVYERNVPVLSLRGNSTPVIVGEKVVVGFASGRLVALAVGDGKLLWESSIAVPKGRTELERMTDIDGPIEYADGVLYASAYHGQVAAIDAESGRIIWTREMSSQLGVTVGEDLVYVTTADGQIWALNRESGATLWMQDNLVELASTRPAIMGDQLVIGDVTGEVYWLSTSDGRLLGRLPYNKVSELSGATDYVDQLDDEGYFPRKRIESSVTFRPEVIGNHVMVTYQSGILASVSAVK
ncbi:MAG: outer membrane protein assembly factor BamB [Gammaproteobacteria bacterium]|nr:outer membrane protein assembly factor BamB [Gammaproteobacteria bacterium]